MLVKPAASFVTACRTVFWPRSRASWPGMISTLAGVSMGVRPRRLPVGATLVRFKLLGLRPPPAGSRSIGAGAVAATGGTAGADAPAAGAGLRVLRCTTLLRVFDRFDVGRTDGVARMRGASTVTGASGCAVCAPASGAKRATAIAGMETREIRRESGMRDWAENMRPRAVTPVPETPGGTSPRTKSPRPLMQAVRQRSEHPVRRVLACDHGRRQVSWLAGRGFSSSSRSPSSSDIVTKTSPLTVAGAAAE